MQRLALFLFALITLMLMPVMAEAQQITQPHLEKRIGWRLILNRPDIKFRINEMNPDQVKNWKNSDYLNYVEDRFSQNKDFIDYKSYRASCKPGEWVSITHHHFVKEKIIHFMVMCDLQMAKQYFISLKEFSKKINWIHHDLYRYGLYSIILIDAMKRSSTSQNRRLEKVLYWFYDIYTFAAVSTQHKLLKYIGESTAKTDKEQFKLFCRMREVSIINPAKKASSDLIRAIKSLPKKIPSRTIGKTNMYNQFRLHIATLSMGINIQLLTGKIAFHSIINCPNRNPFPYSPRAEFSPRLKKLSFRLGIQFTIELMHQMGFTTKLLDRELQKTEILEAIKDLPKGRKKAPPKKDPIFKVKTPKVSKFKAFLLRLPFPLSWSLMFPLILIIFMGFRKLQIITLFLGFTLSVGMFIFHATYPQPFSLAGFIWVINTILPAGLMFKISKSPNPKATKQENTKKKRKPLRENGQLVRVRESDYKSLKGSIFAKKDNWKPALNEEEITFLTDGTIRTIRDHLPRLEAIQKKLIAYENDLKREAADQRKANIHKANLSQASSPQESAKAYETNDEITDSITTLLKQSKDLKWVEQMNERLFAVLAIENGEGRKALKALRYDIQQNPPEK